MINIQPDNDIEEALRQFRSKQEDLAYEAEKSFDRYILSLASGALALSLTAVSTLYSFSKVLEPRLLFLSWKCFALTIVCTLFSLKTSSLSHRKVIKQFDANSYLGVRFGEPWILFTKILNFLSLLLFISGLLTIFSFMKINLYNGKDGNNMNIEYVQAAEKFSQPPDRKGTTPILPPPRPASPSNPSSPKK